MSKEAPCTGEKNGYCFACLARSNGNCVKGKSAEVFIPEPDVPCNDLNSGYCLRTDRGGSPCIHELSVDGSVVACERDL